MTTFNRDQLSDWLHDFLPEEMRERFVVHSVHSKTRSSQDEPYKGICNVDFEVDL